MGDGAVDDSLEQRGKGVVFEPLLEGDIYCAVPALLDPDLVHAAGAREEVALGVELVEGEGAHPVGVDEGLLDAVAVVHVDVWSGLPI